MYISADSPAIYEHQNLIDYFRTNLPEDYFEKAEKELILQLLIDTSGRPCLSSILNSKGLISETLKQLINSMEMWTPAMTNKTTRNISVVLRLVIKKGILKKVEFIGVESPTKPAKKQKEGIISASDVDDALQNINTLTLFSQYGKGLDVIDPRIGRLKMLKELYLGANNFKKIPAEICELMHLEQLLVYDNKLTELPQEIGNLSNLKVLFVNDNEISSFPESISKLKNLVVINIMGNPISGNEIEKLKRLLPNCRIMN